MELKEALVLHMELTILKKCSKIANGIGRYWKKLSVLSSVSADMKNSNIGDYRYRPIWKNHDRSPTTQDSDQKL